MRNRGFPLLFIILIGIIAACSRVQNYPSLANQGILPLSPNNPYLGSNIFISEELERSSYLFNFFRNRGAPTAIEIIDQGARKPLRMLLFYPREKEVYSADLQEFRAYKHGPKKAEWVVRGPYPIDRRDYSALASFQTSFNAEPKFIIHGKPYQFRYHREQTARQVIEPVAPPKPPKPKPQPKKKVKAKVPTDGLPADPKDFRPMNSDQLALYMSKGFAERDASGDVIHTILSNAQTLDAIAKWYTGSEANAAKLREANGIAADAVPSLGTRIRVPMGMVKEFKQLN